MIEVETNGALNIVVDGGRVGSMGLGVSRGGAMDGPAYAIGNHLVGNADGAAGIEVSIFPFRLTFTENAVVAVTGADCRARLGDRDLPPFWVAALEAGDTLRLNAPSIGVRSYVAVAGGLVVPSVLGSSSTDLRGGFGGLDGRGLRRGDRLRVGQSGEGGLEYPPFGFGVVPPSVARLRDELVGSTVRVRVLPAAEYDDFTPAARATFGKAAYEVTAESNRMGTRLSGPALAMERARELLSHGIVPGIVQVPPSGQPIVQLVDANTAGGYPKIATVIDADLWKFAQLPPGTRLAFEIVDLDEAIAARAATAHELTTLKRAISFQRSRN